MSKSRVLITAAIVLGSALAAGAAQARDRDDVQWSVTIGTPAGVPRHVAPAVVYTQPVYTQPVYTQPVYVRDHRYHGQPARWDRDGDGIPNRRDQVYNPRWDIDGDGVSNRHDRDIDGDGIPNRYDRNDYRPDYRPDYRRGYGH